MALGIYMIMFVGMAAISIAGLILLCFLKSEKAKSSMTRAETEIIVTDTALTLFCSLFV